MEPLVIRHGVLDMQVCVNMKMKDDEVENFANSVNPAGKELKWKIRTDPKLLDGDPVRQICAENCNKVHITLDC